MDSLGPVKRGSCQGAGHGEGAQSRWAWVLVGSVSWSSWGPRRLGREGLACGSEGSGSRKHRPPRSPFSGLRAVQQGGLLTRPRVLWRVDVDSRLPPWPALSLTHSVGQ
ncbi:hypothetical protein MC885_012956 [Smutsia gigantea]|nr:hypothetical protein MC885_012956 [Smutsia gigantea]